MNNRNKKRTRTLEVMLIVIGLGLTCLLYELVGYKTVVLNLYYLPVVLGAFFLGRYRAGILALFCVASALTVTMLDLKGFQPHTSPLAVALLVTVWGAVLGLTTLLVGTLSDERSQKIADLHDAYLGIVEVLSGYLNSADKSLENRATRVSELGCQVAAKMKLTEEEIDDIRVAALLQELENIEVTARVISKALGDIGRHGRVTAQEHTFRGTDLVESLASVVYRALPLLVDRDETGEFDTENEHTLRLTSVPIGAKIIHTARSYDFLVDGTDSTVVHSPEEAIDQLRADVDNEHHPAIIDALEQSVLGVATDRRGTRKSVSVEALEV
jgi:hypothetical protein